MQVDRILDEQVSQDDDGNQVMKYLVKWESLPYNESTWELASDINVRVVLRSIFQQCSFLAIGKILIIVRQDDEKIAHFKRINELPVSGKGLPFRPNADEWQEYKDSPE